MKRDHLYMAMASNDREGWGMIIANIYVVFYYLSDTLLAFCINYLILILGYIIFLTLQMWDWGRKRLSNLRSHH